MLPKVPFMDDSIENFTLSLFTEKTNNIYDKLKRKRWKPLVKKCFDGIKKFEEETSIKRMQNISDRHLDYAKRDNLSSILSSEFMEESMSFSRSSEEEEDEEEVVSIPDKAKIQRKTAIGNLIN
jgi:hypothetical protein